MAESLQPFLDGYIPVEKVAEILGVSVSTVYNYQKAGKGPLRYKFGRRCLYKRTEVIEWAKNHLLTPAGGEL